MKMFIWFGRAKSQNILLVVGLNCENFGVNALWSVARAGYLSAASTDQLNSPPARASTPSRQVKI